MSELDKVNEELRRHASPPTDGEGALESQAPGLDGLIHLYVCTHGQRDCRCRDTGGAVYEALVRGVESRGLSDKVKVGGVAHVGGHKFAANVLVFPWGEWLGNVNQGNISTVLDEILSKDPTVPQVANEPPLCPPLWRGRMGLDKEEQLAQSKAP